MRLKFILLFLILPVLVFYSCVEEPFIEPVKSPYSVVRVANFLANVDNIEISIDKVKPVQSLANLSKENLTGYFDLKSGARTFLVKNVATGDTIFNAKIDITSYSRMTVIFSGWFSKNELQNTSTYFVFDEGEVYVSGAPDSANSAHVYFLHTSPDSPTSTARKYTVNYTFKGPADTTYSSNATVGTTTLEALKIRALRNAKVGNYKFRFVSTAPAETLSYDTDINNGLRYYIFLAGPPENMKVVKNELVPLPVRGK